MLRDGFITSEHIHAAFELRPGPEVRNILAQACVTSYMLSDSMEFEFKFTDELETISGFCQALLKEVAQAMASTLANNNMFDPLTNAVLPTWLPGFRDTRDNDWGTNRGVMIHRGN